MSEFGVTKFGGFVRVPRELLLDAGVVAPTPAERADAERRAAEDRAHYEARRAVRAAARARLAGIADQPSRAVLDLHHEGQCRECAGCDFSGYEAEAPVWPCRTVETIAEHYGIRPGDL